MESFLSDYHEAKRRFETTTEHDQKNSTSDQRNKYLDEVIEKLCKKSDTIVLKNDYKFFYELLFHSDFLQIKQEIIEIFYSELCLQFIRQNIFEDIIRNLDMLELVPHLKKFLAMGLLQSCQLEPMVKTNSLSFRNASAKIWHTLNLNNIHEIIIPKSAIRDSKITKSTYTIRCLKIFLRLCNFERLKLFGWNLNESNAIILSEEFHLRSLNLTNCGPYVNVILQSNQCGILNHLTELDISNNNVVNATLNKIRLLPLKSLNMSNCIRTSNLKLKSIQYPTFSNSSELDEEETNLDVLWEDGVLKETIEILDISFNDLSETNLKHILQRPLKQLDISSCLNSTSVDFFSLVLPSTLKVLKAQYNKFAFDDRQVICDNSLEELRINFFSTEQTLDEFQFLNIMKKVKSIVLFNERSHRPYIAMHRFD